jgi:hypothetical protein
VPSCSRPEGSERSTYGLAGRAVAVRAISEQGDTSNEEVGLTGKPNCGLLLSVEGGIF